MTSNTDPASQSVTHIIQSLGAFIAMSLGGAICVQVSTVINPVGLFSALSVVLLVGALVAFLTLCGFAVQLWCRLPSA